jgi:hypothetical protein
MDDERSNRTDANGRSLVDCDELCNAYADPDPDSLTELRVALEHWRHHGYLSGCSHAW